ncbi:hypothetical protein [uncultured Chryseobacterium sp.]|nr:hypothetical protein [uncultured Chryseobacterium sp.]
MRIIFAVGEINSIKIKQVKNKTMIQYILTGTFSSIAPTIKNQDLLAS